MSTICIYIDMGAYLNDEGVSLPTSRLKWVPDIGLLIVAQVCVRTEKYLKAISQIDPSLVAENV